jgi:hypothetical protein
MRKFFEICFGVLYFVGLFRIIDTYAYGSFIAAVLLSAGYGGLTMMAYLRIKRFIATVRAGAQEDAA